MGLCRRLAREAGEREGGHLGIAHEGAGLVAVGAIKDTAAVAAGALVTEDPEAAAHVAHAPVVARLRTVRRHLLQHLRPGPLLLLTCAPGGRWHCTEESHNAMIAMAKCEAMPAVHCGHNGSDACSGSVNNLCRIAMQLRLQSMAIPDAMDCN